jgi:hypothetical protein
MVMRMAQKLEQPSVLVDVSWNPVLILFTLYVKEVGVAVQIMIFGVVFLGDGINTYININQNKNVFFGITFIRYTQIQMFKSFRER